MELHYALVEYFIVFNKAFLINRNMKVGCVFWAHIYYIIVWSDAQKIKPDICY